MDPSSVPKNQTRIVLKKELSEHYDFIFLKIQFVTKLKLQIDHLYSNSIRWPSEYNPKEQVPIHLPASTLLSDHDDRSND